MGRNLVVVAYTPSLQNKALHIYIHVLSARDSELIQFEGEGAS